MTRPDFAEDSRAWKIYASTPTISVPNWASLVTGVPPEINGYPIYLFIYYYGTR